VLCDWRTFRSYIDWPTICHPLYLGPACKIYYTHYNISVRTVNTHTHIIYIIHHVDVIFPRVPKKYVCGHSGGALFLTRWSIILLCQVYTCSLDRGVILYCFDESSVERGPLLPCKKLENCFTHILKCFKVRYTFGRKIYVLGIYIIIEGVDIVESLLRGTNFCFAV